jgi:hypothetical protein
MSVAPYTPPENFPSSASQSPKCQPRVHRCLFSVSSARMYSTHAFMLPYWRARIVLSP